jgi:hypothetical protein
MATTKLPTIVKVVITYSDGTTRKLTRIQIENSWLGKPKIDGLRERRKVSARNSASAKQPRKLSETDRARLIELYEERVRQGTTRGAIQVLAPQFKISEATAHKVLKPYKPPKPEK